MPVYKTIDELPIELNIRDLGGLEARDGRHVKNGLLFRSAAPYFFNEEQLEPVKALRLKTILDFRTESGADKRPDPALEGAEYFNKCAAFGNPLDDLNSPSELFSLLFDADQKGNLTDVLVSTYTASLAFSNEAYKFMFNKLLEGDAPLLFHCSNGKDRTGVAAGRCSSAVPLLQRQGQDRRRGHADPSGPGCFGGDRQGRLPAEQREPKAEDRQAHEAV